MVLLQQTKHKATVLAGATGAAEGQSGKATARSEVCYLRLHVYRPCWTCLFTSAHVMRFIGRGCSPWVSVISKLPPEPAAGQLPLGC
jgi:hypothetical protein